MVTRLARLPLDFDKRPLDMQVALLTGADGNSGQQIPRVEMPDGSPLDAIGLVLIDASGNVIDPASVGASSGTIGLFTAAGSAAIPAIQVAVYTSGYSTQGRGAGLYVEDLTIDDAYVAANPRTAFKTTNGRRFRLGGDRITPFMLGAVGLNYNSVDTSTDDALALQYFWDLQWDYRYWGTYFDAGFDFCVRDRVHIGVELGAVAGLTDQLSLRGRMPRLYVPSGATTFLADKDNYVAYLHGTHFHYDGQLMVHDNNGYLGYAARRFYGGIRVVQASEAYVASIAVFGAKRWGMFEDTPATAWSYTTSTGRTIGSSSRNAIGFEVGRTYFQSCGPHNAWTGAQQLILPVTSYTQGGQSSPSAAFDPTPGSYAFAGNATRVVTSGSTADLDVDDVVESRLDLKPADYTTIAVDAAVSTMTFTAGDPIALGLSVGTAFYLVDNSNTNANRGIWVEIVAFSGGSNRTIKVATLGGALTTAAAFAFDHLYTEWCPHVITKIESGTQFVVQPWVADKAELNIYCAHGGGLKTDGVDQTATHYGQVKTFQCAASMWHRGLYAPQISSWLTDIGELGVVMGSFFNGSFCNGLKVDGGHCEAAKWNMLEFYPGVGAIDILATADYGSIRSLGTKSSTAQQKSIFIQASSGMSWDLGGVRTEARPGGRDGFQGGGNTIGNNPKYNMTTVKADDFTFTLSYDDSVVSISNRCDALVYWHGAGGIGAAPTGTGAFALDAYMTARNWTVTGDTSVVAPIAPVLFRLTYDRTARVVNVQALTGMVTRTTVVTDTTVARTFTWADRNNYIRFTNAAAITATVPPNSTRPFPIGTEITIEQAGAGALSVAAGAGVTINSRGADLTLAGQYAVATLKKVATDTWTLMGDL